MFLQNKNGISFIYFCFLCYFLLYPLNTVDAWNAKILLLIHQHRRTNSFIRLNSVIWKTPTALSLSASSTEIPSIEGPFHGKAFADTKSWGQRPLLLKQSFGNREALLPTWNDICELAIQNGEAESITSRLITHKQGTLDTFKLHFGPFSESELSSFIGTAADNDEHSLPDDDTKAANQVSTLVVNDVDRWIPGLSDWMDQQFGFLPRWRRDDAQVSLAKVGGGIGPHVDNYDVFLIQVSGTRTWKVGLGTLSVKEEFGNLVEASEVRVLDLQGQQAGEFVTVTVRPGDCLYLPPRVVHWGSATSDDCMTLSVGCRAPSASELLQRVAESVSDSSALATARYTDIEDIESWSNPMSSQGKNQRDLSKKAKDKMKRLVLDLIEEQLEDDAVWDKLVGELVTEPNRPSMDFPMPLSEMDEEWKADLGIWASSKSALDRVLSGNGVLRRAEGIAFAHSSSEDKEKLDHTLFAQGRSFPLNDNSDDASLFLDMIANGMPLSQQQFEDQGMQLSDPMKSLLLDLLEEGLIYGDYDGLEEENS